MSSAIIYGSRGSLGSALVSLFKSKGWKIVGIDTRENIEVDSNIVVDSCLGLSEQGSFVLNSMEKLDFSKNSFSAIIVASGGWEGGNAASKNFFSSTEISLAQSVYTSTIAAKLASIYLAEGGVALFTGAHAALAGTPGMIGYGLAKAAVHHLVKSLSLQGSGLPNNSLVYCLMPITLDTKPNRDAMPNSDFSSWTPLPTLSSEIYGLCTKTKTFENGHLITVSTENNITTLR
ncbi:Dihydropteridine reductase [Smittium mucronatum]|uniref:Dihydropteridine reductase n=1 Tax=Smittium mucronatum TaxID=133383 RepID=A0A1R0GLF6_9FUNG|nr:Dihydropteridine reductase [Smittium mucronatum]